MNHFHKYALCIFLTTTVNINAAEVSTNAADRVNHNPLLREALNYAIDRNDIPGMNYLLAANPHYFKPLLKRDHVPFKKSPIVVAAKTSDAALQGLLARGANPNQTNNDGKAALHYVSTPNSALRLIQRGANVNLQDLSGLTPLHCVALNAMKREGKGYEYNDPEIAELLMNHGAFLCVQDNSGDTPIHLLLSEGTGLTLVVQMLRKAQERGIMPTLSGIRNHAGQTILDLVNSSPDFDENLAREARELLFYPE
jgi:ankyrin repeat protein